MLCCVSHARALKQLVQPRFSKRVTSATWLCYCLPRMPAEYDDDLKTECAGWVAEQLADEGVMIDPPLVFMLLNMEEHIRETSPEFVPHAAMAERVAALAAEEGVRSEPAAIDPPLVRNILSWEDEFLSFAGMPRRAS